MWVLHPTSTVNMRSEFCCCLCFQVLRHNRTIILAYLFKAFWIQKVPEAFKIWIRLVFAYIEFSEKSSYYIFHTHTHTFFLPDVMPALPRYGVLKCNIFSCFSHWVVKKERSSLSNSQRDDLFPAPLSCVLFNPGH